MSRQDRFGKTHYYSAGAFVQNRLDKYIASIASGGYAGVHPSGYGGGPYGGGTGGTVATSAITSWLVVEPDSTSLSGSGLNATADLSNILWSFGGAFGTGGLSVSRIDIEETGYYHISVVMLCGVRTTAGSTWMEVLVRDETDTTVKSVQDLYGQHATPNNDNQTLKASFSFIASAGYDVKILFNSTTGTLFSIDSSIVSIEKLAS